MSLSSLSSYEINPKRAGEISRDVMKMVSPLFKAIYNISVSYDTSASGVWNILCEGDLDILKREMESYGLSCEGEVRKTANIDKIVSEQRIDVDAVSGATNSSTVLKKAVENALLLPEMQTGKID